ncbi:tbc1 domain family member whacked [Anaeramoeba ignava]|uniref:Tbc1 domain family member whacked n=1 Tax=Anaeramoeba ignava TaxID=1746090 RepID=A0A9Q0RIN5_ANAIG|nr:tbc1 domain family member whacked [Anaeramoeba ignava]
MTDEKPKEKPKEKINENLIETDEKEKEKEKENQEEKDKEKLFDYDRYGFLLDKKLGQKRTTSELKNVQREVERGTKWREMMDQWEKYATKKSGVLKRRIRKGIPDSFRGEAWMKISQSEILRDRMRKKEGADFYLKLLEEENEEANAIIERDLNRTFPKHENYRVGSEQKRLSRILRAWSVYNKTVGYCQGMAFVAALLLFYLEEEDAFWTFVVLMEQYHMSRLYSIGFPLFQQQLYQWDKLFEKLDKKVFLHFQEQSVMSQMYGSRWFLTIFANTFSFPIVLRIFDIFLHEGIEFVFHVAFAIIKLFRKQMLEMQFEQLVQFVQNINLQPIDEDELISTATSISIKYKDLARWADEYHLQQEEQKEK